MLTCFYPVPRYVPPVDSDYYEGTGFSKGVIERAAGVIVFSISLHSRSENGVLLYIGNEVMFVFTHGIAHILLDSLKTCTDFG